MLGKTTDTENRTNVNVSKKFRDLMQNVVSLYNIKTGKKITIGNAIESIVAGNEELKIIYNETMSLLNKEDDL